MMPKIFTDLFLLKEVFHYHSKIILENADGLILLFTKSDGSKYHGYRKQLLDTYIYNLKLWFDTLEDKNKFERDKADNMIFRTIGSIYIAYIEEILNNRDDIEIINLYTDKIATIIYGIFRNLLID
ncbi:MAG: hypothetical protein Q4P34_07585, partial [Tissierellia bacterium]|nr:hypothetical protein [Tissierellia bacterium]